MTNLEVWYARTDVEQLRAELESQLTKRQRKTWDAGEAKARSSDSMQSLRKLTQLADGRPRIVANAPLIVPLRDLPGGQGEGIEAWLVSLLEKYRQTMESDRRHLLEQYEFADLARKVVGVGSVGTRCWIVLMFGRDDTDPLFLQVKEAQASVLTRYVGGRRPAHQGQRVVAGQRLIQAASDIFLGWVEVDVGARRPAARLLRAPAARLEVLLRHRGHGARGHARVRAAVRLDPGQSARQVGRPPRHRRLPRRLGGI